MAGMPPQPQVQNVELAYFDFDRLLESVESGAIAPVRGTYVIELQASGGRIARRQDLPPPAFWTAEELRAVFNRVSQHFGAQSAELGLLFVALSYRWLSGPHPDPDGFHLEHIARIARGDEGGKGYLNFVRETVFAKVGLEAEADFALFWDFASLYQTPRTEDETGDFRAGLRRATSGMVTATRSLGSSRGSPRASR